MKKILFLALFLISNSFVYGANIIIILPDPNNIYYLDQSGKVTINYSIYLMSNFYNVDTYQIRLKQYNIGNWGPWVTGRVGSWVLYEAGEYITEAKVHVVYDLGGGSDYWMYITNPVRFTVIDQYAPSIPTGLSASANPSDNRVKLSWTANTEYDVTNGIQGFYAYEISRKVNEGGWNVIANTNNTSYVDESWYYDTHSTFALSYRIRVNDINGNISNYCSILSSGGWPMGKKTFNSQTIAAGDLENESIPQEYKVSNYPNPFNPRTNITYQIKERGFVTLKVYNMLGKLVSDLVSETKEPGQYTVNFNAGNLPSGIYIYSLQVNEYIQNKTMMLIK